MSASCASVRFVAIMLSTAGMLLVFGTWAIAQQPARQPTRQVDGQNRSGGSGVFQQSTNLNRQQTRQVQGQPGATEPTLDQQSGRFQIERKVIRRGLGRLPQRPTARWRLGIFTNNSPRGLRISGVAQNSPAYRFGLEEGDYLLDVMGYPVGFHGNSYYPLAETLNQTVQRDGWVNVLLWNKRTNSEESMWVQAESRHGGGQFRRAGESSEN